MLHRPEHEGALEGHRLYKPSRVPPEKRQNGYDRFCSEPRGQGLRKRPVSGLYAAGAPFLPFFAALPLSAGSPALEHALTPSRHSAAAAQSNRGQVFFSAFIN